MLWSPLSSGVKWLGLQVPREKENKWYVTQEEFSGDTYEPYCSGSAYLLSGDLIQPLLWASLREPFFWVDDYFFTGALAKVVGARHLDISSLFGLDERERGLERAARGQRLFAHAPRQSLSLKYAAWRQLIAARFPHFLLPAIPHLLPPK